MGARNSKPHTMHINNPTPATAGPPVAVELSADVMHRLQDRSKKQLPAVSLQCTNSQHEDAVDETAIAAPIIQAETESYVQTMQRLDELMGRPLQWAENIRPQVDELHKEVIACYNANPHETLKCTQEANKFQKFIFDEQYKTLMEQKVLPQTPLEEDLNLEEASNK